MKELESLADVEAHLSAFSSLAYTAIQEVDFSGRENLLNDVDVTDTFFLGCVLSSEAFHRIQHRGGYVFRSPPDYAFRPFRSTLYSPAELYDRFDPSDPCTYCDCTDARIYRHWDRTGRETVTSIVDAMFRGIHDRSINDALYEFLDDSGKGVVAVMGGHSLARDSDLYRDIAHMARTLSRENYLMISGGGPGAMESMHLGAMMAPADDPVLDRAMTGLAAAPSYRDRWWLSTAIQVLEELKNLGVPTGESLGIPTWLYGHEPPTPFASHIAKFFNNSIREEGLVSVANAGIIFAPGSAGTVQEIFQDATQNHYATMGYACPMVFLGKSYWTETIPVYPVLQAMSQGKPYADNLFLVDDSSEAVACIRSSVPITVDSLRWNFCDAFCREAGG